MASKQQIEIPVGAAFEKRLAELVWEHCPELARQTAAGRMALAIDVSDPDTIDVAVKTAVEDAASQLVGPLIESSRSLLEESGIEQVVTKAREMLESRLVEITNKLEIRVRNSVEQSIQDVLRSKVAPEVRDVADCLFRERPLARLVREKLEALISEYLAEKLEPEKSGRGTLIAAEAEMVTRVAESE